MTAVAWLRFSYAVAHVDLLSRQYDWQRREQLQKLAVSSCYSEAPIHNMVGCLFMAGPQLGHRMYTLVNISYEPYIHSPKPQQYLHLKLHGDMNSNKNRMP